MIAILGPTSSGKTSLALQIAKKYDLSIISCDSRQIYKYFDVGTGKIPINSNYDIKKTSDYYLIDGIKVFGYDIADPHQVYSAYDFAEYFKSISDKLEGKFLLVGGTGFYADIALYGVNSISRVEPNTELRDELQNYTPAEIIELLPNEVINSLNDSEKNNKQRLIRKVEIISELGKIPQPVNSNNLDNHSIILLDAGNEILFSKVDFWVETIWTRLIDELNMLLNYGFRDTSPIRGIIYKTGIDLLDKKISEEEAKQLIKFDLHKYIRRQKTWFKRYKTASIVDISINNTYNEVENIAVKQINAK